MRTAFHFSAVLGIVLATHALMAQNHSLNTSLPLDIQNQSYTMATGAAFMLQGLQFTPEDSVYIFWDHDTQLFSVYGEATVQIGNRPMHLSLGTLAIPSLLINADTTVSGFQMTITDTFELKKLVFLEMDDMTQLSYDFDALQYEITGDARMVLSGTHYDVGLGNSSSPGMIYKNNEIMRVIVNVNSTMEMHGLVATDPSIVLKWSSGNPLHTYYGHGQLSVFIQGGYYHADVGTNSNPGLTIVNGHVQDVTMNILGGAFLFNALPTYGAFSITYSHSRSVFVMTGHIVVGIPFGTLFNLPQLSIFTGDADSGGIEYHTDTKNFHVADATFEVRNIGGKDTLSVLGGFQLKELGVRVQDDVPVEFFGSVILPIGVALAADFDFTYDPDNNDLPFFIHSIALEWAATSVATAIPMGNTGFFLVRLAGSITNLDKPAQLTFSDTIGFTFGEVISVNIPLLGAQEVAPAYFEGFATFSAHELSMGVSGDIGAKFVINHWQGLLGEAEVVLDFVFGHRYSMTGMISLPSDPLLIATAEAVFSQSGDLDLLASAQLVVPHFIPIIGGKTFGNVNGALRMKHGDPHNSFGAGWFRLNLLFDHVTLGALYNIATGNIHKIGAGDAEDITTAIENDMVDPPPGDPPPSYWQCTLHHDFTVPTNKPAAYLQSHLKILSTWKFVDPHPNDDDPNITVTARIESLDPNYPNLEAFRPEDSLDIFPSSNGLELDGDGIVNIHLNIVDSVAWIAANHGAEIYGVINWPEQPEVLLTPGTHTMIVEGWCPLNVSVYEEDISFTTSPAYPRPTAIVTMDPVWSADLLYSAYLTDSTDISLFFSKDTSRNGRLINRWAYFFGGDVPTMPGYRNFGFPGIDQQLPPFTEDTVYFYAVINDRVNPVVYSVPAPYAAAGTREISGYVQMTDGTGVSGVPVMMFRESNPADRLTTYTDSTGRYAFYNCRVNTPLIIQAFAPEGHYFSQAVDVSADFVAREIKTPDWMELTVQLHPGDNITADFELTDMPVTFYGAVYDTNLMSIPGVWVFVSTVGGSVVAQQQTTEFGFAFFNLSPQDYEISMLLPTDSNGYHWPTQMLEGNSVKERIDTITFSGTPVRLDYHAVSGNSPFFAFIEAGTSERLAGGQVELNLPGTQDNPFISIISGANGFVSFDEQDLTPGQLYDVMVTAPPGYHCQNNCLMNFTWYGNQQQITPLYMVAD